ncbi:MAG TPA: hypothetical protein VFG03_04005 [Telluria sp.]|nr:hypothetical protein [Telluria sp.]
MKKNIPYPQVERPTPTYTEPTHRRRPQRILLIPSKFDNITFEDAKRAIATVFAARKKQQAVSKA